MSYAAPVPFKHQADRRHRTPRARYRVTNWPAYEARLRRHGNLTLWLDQAGLAGWRVRAGSGRVHLVLDSTGLELLGQGGWCAAKHGRSRRRWRKLPLGVDATTGEIAAHVLTDGHADDAAQVPDLLRQPEGDIASLTADGAYDGGAVCQAAVARQPGRPPDVVIAPRSSAVLSTADPDRQNSRDRHIRLMAEHGRMAWQRMTGYGRRNAAATAIGRHERLIGPKAPCPWRCRSGGRGRARCPVLNRMIREAKPITVRRS